MLLIYSSDVSLFISTVLEQSHAFVCAWQEFKNYVANICVCVCVGGGRETCFVRTDRVTPSYQCRCHCTSTYPTNSIQLTDRLTESCTALCNGEQMHQRAEWVCWNVTFQCDMLPTFNVLMTSNLNFRHRPPSDVSSCILTESQSPVSVVLDDTVQGVHHQFTQVSVSSVDCNRTGREVCQVSFQSCRSEWFSDSEYWIGHRS